MGPRAVPPRRAIEQLPLAMCVSPRAVRHSIDLPAPTTPVTAQTSPIFTCKLTFLRTKVGSSVFSSTASEALFFVFFSSFFFSFSFSFSSLGCASAEAGRFQNA